MSTAGTRTLADEIAWATGSLQEVGVDSPRLDAELLLAHLLRIDRTALLLRAGEPVSSDVRTLYLALVARRARYEPIAYILGKRGFRRLDLAVDARVLIPRPETEHLVEAIVELAPQGARVADVGTGSGAVALALADERPDLQVTGIDISAGALAVAKLNGARRRLDVRWVCADLLDDGEYDVIAANLPYIADDALLPPDVARWEPAKALQGGPDGLDQIRRLLALVSARPAVSLLALEIGYDQGAAVSALAREAGFGQVEVRADLAGLDRVVIGRR